MMGCTWRSRDCLKVRLTHQKARARMMPSGKPRSRSEYMPPSPKALRGPMVPQSTEAVKNELTCGHVNLLGALLVHTSGIDIWKFSTPVQTKVDTKVATICTANASRGGTYSRQRVSHFCPLLLFPNPKHPLVGGKV